MALIEWDDTFSVNVKRIDEQHKKLVSLLNQLFDAISASKSKQFLLDLLQELADYTVYHFDTEEELMKKYNFDGYQEHKEEHDEFVKRVLDFQDTYQKGRILLDIEVLYFLRDWVSNHILGTDKKYSSFFNEHGIY